jgi:hypothetical protein
MVDLLRGHCFNYLFRELGLKSPYHSFRVFVGFSHVIVRSNWCKQFKAMPFPSAFEINIRTSPFSGYNMCPPF